MSMENEVQKDHLHRKMLKCAQKWSGGVKAKEAALLLHYNFITMKNL